MKTAEQYADAFFNHSRRKEVTKNDLVELFAAAISAAKAEEREACATIAEDFMRPDDGFHITDGIAKAIRARAAADGKGRG